jgi:hypothetical protein
MPVKRKWKNRGSTSAVHAVNIPQQPPNITIFQLPRKSAAIQNLTSFAYVHFIGASTMRNVVKNNTHHYENNTFFYEIKKPLNTTTVNEFISHLTNVRRNGYTGASNTAIVLGSDIWDVLLGENQGLGFEDHLEACKRLVEAARLLYPNATLVWK